MIMEDANSRGRRWEIQGNSSYYFGRFSASLKLVQIKFWFFFLKGADNTLFLLSWHANVKDFYNNYKVKYKIQIVGPKNIKCFAASQSILVTYLEIA